MRDFVENESGGQLPLSGKLPDMKSDTMNYIALQNIYREKALSDLEAVKKRVKGLVEGTDMVIPDETIEIFCKNAANIRVIQYHPLTENHVQAEKIGKQVNECSIILCNFKNNPLKKYSFHSKLD